jgi:hypothetical protein
MSPLASERKRMPVSAPPDVRPQACQRKHTDKRQVRLVMCDHNAQYKIPGIISVRTSITKGSLVATQMVNSTPFHIILQASRNKKSEMTDSHLLAPYFRKHLARGACLPISYLSSELLLGGHERGQMRLAASRGESSRKAENGHLFASAQYRKIDISRSIGTGHELLHGNIGNCVANFNSHG